MRRKGRVSHDQNFFTVAILCILLFPCAYRSDTIVETFPTINKCCPEGSFYSLDSSTCVEWNVKLKDKNLQVQDNGNSSLPSELSKNEFSSYNAEPALEDYITLPRSLVIDLRSNVSDYEINRDFRFRLRPHLPTKPCSKGNFIVHVQLRKKYENIPSGNFESEFRPSIGNISIETTSANFTSRGQIKIGNEYYSPPEFCLLGLKDDILSLRVCNATCSGETPCIRKCCDLNQVWNIARGRRQGCYSAGENLWDPTLYKYPKTKATEDELKDVFPHYKIIHPKSFCNSSTVPFAIEQRDEFGRHYWKFRVNTEGHVFRRISRYTWLYEDDHPDSYCLDGAINSRYSTEGTNQTEFSGAEEDAVLFECLPPLNIGSRPQSILYGVLMIFSCFLLLLTILVHILLWDRQPNHAWTLTLISYDLSLFCMYFVFVLMHFSQFYLRQSRGDQINPFCYSIGVGINFFVVSTFCWMSAVNFDLFRTFKVLKPTAGRSQGLKRYLSYAVFAWIVPISIVTVGIVLDSKYRNDFDSGIIVPEYGRKRCQLDSEYGQLVYSYGPAGVLLLFNLGCFVYTVYIMYSVQKSTKFATTSSSKKNKQRQSLKLFAKLIFVMGFPWVFELISWYTERDKTNGNSWYWVFFDVINILQAVAIFWTFVCKPDVFRMLEQKYPCFERFLDRVMLDSTSAEKISTRHPSLKRFVKPITRRDKKSVSGGRNGTLTTEMSSTMSTSSNQPESMKRDNVKMQEAKLSQKSTKSSSGQAE